MQEAIPCEQIDQRTPAKPEIPNTEDKKAEEALLISSLTTHVLNSPNKSMLIADLIKNFAQQKRGNVDDPMSHNDSEIHAARRGNLERPEVSKSEDRLRCRRCLSYSRDQAKKFAAVVATRSGRKQSNESAVDSSCTSLVLMIQHWKMPKEADAMEHLKNRKNSKEQKITWIPRKSTIAEGLWSDTPLTSNVNPKTSQDSTSPVRRFYVDIS